MKKKSFVPDILIVIAIILVVARFIGPKPWGSSIRANEATAVTLLKRYHEAQLVFSARKLAAIPGNANPALGETAYADTFRILYYGKDVNDRELHLINKGMADTRVDEKIHLVGPFSFRGKDEGQFYFGYLFLDDPSGALSPDDYERAFGLLALPKDSSTTGSNAYWIGKEGIVYTHGLETGLKVEDALALFKDVPGSTPAAAKPILEWERLED
jgi:hypothetical protein